MIGEIVDIFTSLGLPGRVGAPTKLLPRKGFQ